MLVEDGAIVVLGGCCKTSTPATPDKVPGLGDVPLFGNLFRSETRSRKKTNLMVFLRPVVVRDAPPATRLDRPTCAPTSASGSPRPAWWCPVEGAPVMPPPPAQRPAPTPAPAPVPG